MPSFFTGILRLYLDGFNKIDLTINEGSFNLGNIGGAVSDAQVPDNITINNATTADALSANGGNCLAGYVPLGVDTFGASEGCFDVTTQSEFDNHPHSAADITSGTFADARIAQSNVTQHQAALVITESQISDFIPNPTQEDIQDAVGPMVSGNTETLLSVTYDDLDNQFDFTVENDLSLFSWLNVNATHLKVGAITQGYDADLDDLADGKLTNSKVAVIDGSQYTNFGGVMDDTIDELFAAIDASWPTGGSGEANTASNQGVGGVGLFGTKVGVDLQFKNINAGSNKISVINDAVNKEVDIDVVEANINHQNISGTGANTHAQIDSHLSASAGVHGVTGNVVGASDAQTLTNKVFLDNSTTFQDDLDNTKRLILQLSGIATLATRILTVPDENGVICTTGSVCSGYQSFLGYTAENTANKGAASGYASLDAGSLVVQNPANATATPTASRIPIADGIGKLDGWTTLGATVESAEITDGTIVDGDLDPASDLMRGGFGITIDGGGSVITTGVKGFVEIPYNCTVKQWTILADQSGSIAIDVWKDTYANFPPTLADAIAGSEKPALSSAQKNQDSSLTTWATAVTAGDIVAFNVDSATTVTRINLFIPCDKN